MGAGMERTAAAAASNARATLAGMSSLTFLDGLPEHSRGAASEPLPDAEALDAYSRVVTTVAERLASSVANLRVWNRRRSSAGGGSGVVITPDGFIVTSAHVVAGTG